MIRGMDKDNILGQMGIIMMANGRMAKERILTTRPNSSFLNSDNAII